MYEITTMTRERLERQQIRTAVEAALAAQPVLDMHTHAYPPRFGTPVPNATGQTDPTGLMLWGIDELLTYHYLIAEVYRVVTPDRLPYERFWAMSKSEQADHIWKHLFQERTLGTSFIPQHSDARVLDQLIYKWDHSRRTIGKVLADTYEDLVDAGWPLTRDELARDARLLLRDNFVEFAGLS